MRAIDTNVLVRIVARDDARQLEAAEAFITPGAWISLLVLAEAAWVWSSVYQATSDQIADGIQKLLDHQQFVLQEPDVVDAALQGFRRRPTLSFSDYLILEMARKAGFLPLGTFDRDLAKVDGAINIEHSR